MPMYETRLMDLILFWSKQHLVYASLMASCLICGQTDYYITVSLPVVKWQQMICNTGGSLRSAHGPTHHYTNSVDGDFIHIGRLTPDNDLHICL